MKYGAILASLMLLLSTIILALPDSAEAARMGGGRSFGSRPSMNAPAQRPAMRQQTPAQNNNPAAAATQRPGMGMMGGLLGGLLAGTLLGSLLSGGGFSGGGFMDLILIGILAFLGYTLYKRFRQRPQPAPAAQGYGAAFNNTGGGNSSQWNSFRQNAQPAAGAADPAVDVPAGFDVDEFLRGAKAAYVRMQKSWDNRDLKDIAQFATPAVMTVLEQQRAEDPNPSHTELMLVNASLLGVEDEGSERRAQVYFDVMMREDPSQQTPSAVREIWHFVRSGQNGNWLLDGIQQVE